MLSPTNFNQSGCSTVDYKTLLRTPLFFLKLNRKLLRYQGVWGVLFIGELFTTFTIVAKFLKSKYPFYKFLIFFKRHEIYYCYALFPCHVYRTFPQLFPFHHIHAFCSGSPIFPPSRYEQGLEDYEEAAQRVEQEQLQEQKVSRQQQLSGLARPFMTLFSVLGNALSSGRSMQVATGPDPSWLFRGILGAGRKGDDGQVGKSTSSDDDDAADNQNGNEYFRWWQSFYFAYFGHEDGADGGLVDELVGG